ncbi:MAG: hypothetical protein WAP98_04155 [Caldicoprobacterales bacterium]|nr:hypothetical protein [Clostridia bacterium]MDI9511563.1 hypothetical protein [Bacillota bacterium]NLH59728.1 hypothetical protein [Clostridiales bacterium]
MKGKRPLLLLVLLFVIVLSSCNFSVSTARVKEVYPCRSVDEDAKPVDETDVFSSSDTIMYVSALTANVPSDTRVKIVWKYNDGSGEQFIDDVELVLDKSRYIQTHLSSQEGFPQGTYIVEFFINDRQEPDKVANLTVK